MTRTETFHIEQCADVGELANLYKASFPDEDLFPLVCELLALENETLSLAVKDDARAIGHLLLTMCSVTGSRKEVGLLGPVAVIPEFQKQDVGTKLIKEAFRRLKRHNVNHVYVLGDPAYYGRFGFKTESNVKTPYPIPQEWFTGWQSLVLDDANTKPEGVLRVPEPWQKPELWTE